MKWCLRLLQMFILLVLMSFIGFIALITLVDPNQYKDTLIKHLALKNDRILEIKGPLRWRIINGITIEASDITLSNRLGFDNVFLTIKKAQIAPHFWSLITGKILIDLKLYDADLSLIRKSITFNNWQDLLESIFNKKTKFGPKIILNAVELKNSNVFWHDDLLNRHYLFKNVSLNTGSLLQALKANYCLASLEFDLNDQSQERLNNAESRKQKEDHKTLHARLNAQWKLTKGIKNIELQNITIHANLMGVNPIVLTLNKATIQDLITTPIFSGHLTIKPIELTPWLSFFKIKASPYLSKYLDLNAQFKYTHSVLDITSFNLNAKPLGYFEGNIKIENLNSINEMKAEGIIFSKNLKIGTMDIPEMKANIVLKSQVLTLNPIEYQYAGGEHHGSFQIDYSTPHVKYRFSQESNHFEITNILETLGYHNKMEGRANVKFNFSSEGNNLNQIRENVTGQGEFEIMHGKILGIDAQKLLKHAQGTIKSLMYAAHNKKTTNLSAVLKSELGKWEEQSTQQTILATPFTHIKGSFSLSSLTITNPDLSIIHPQYTIHGNGTLNLGDENLFYHLFGLYKDHTIDPNDEVGLFLNQTPLAVDIKGPLQEPGLRPDLENYAQRALKFSQRNMFEKFVDKTFNQIPDTTNEFE